MRASSGQSNRLCVCVSMCARVDNIFPASTKAKSVCACALVDSSRNRIAPHESLCVCANFLLLLFLG